MRITHNSVATSVLSNLQGNITRLGQTQERLSSGRVINRSSDSPGGAVSAMQMRSQLAVARQYTRNADDGLGWLGVVDTALTSAMEQTRRIRDLTVQGISTGIAGQESRDAIAAEIDGLRESLIGLANSTYLDRPVFGGTTPGSTAYQPSGPTAGDYVGDDGAVMRTVGANTQVRVDSPGREVFGDGVESLFSIVADLSTHIKSDPASVPVDLNRLDVAIENLQGGLSSVGARYNQVDRMRQMATDNEGNLKKTLSDIEDIDLPQTITELQLQQTAYQAALAAGARVVQPSLIDFLR